MSLLALNTATGVDALTTVVLAGLVKSLLKPSLSIVNIFARNVPALVKVWVAVAVVASTSNVVIL